MPSTQQLLTTTSIGGVPNVGVKNVITTGNVYFVDSNNGSATNAGTTPSAAINTIANALALCVSNRADVLVLMPGHAETLTASLSLSIEGLRIVGLGEGDNRPQITFGTDTGANWALDADNITIENVIFKNDIDSQVDVLNVSNAYARIQNCEFWEGSSKQYLIAISLDHANSDHCKILGCLFNSKTAGANSAIKIGAALSNLEIAYCRIVGDWADAGIHNPTGNVATELSIHDNYIENDQTGDHAIELVSACTGGIYDNALYADAIATVLDPGSCKCAGNKANVAIDQGAVEVPLGATSSDFIGADNADNNAATTNVVANKDGSVLERLEDIKDELSGTAGIVTYPAAAAAANGVSIAEVLRYIEDLLQGSAGVVTFPSGAAAANGVSLAEVLRYIQDQIINGTGTVLDTNTSLYGVLAGATGIPTYPASAAPANGVSIAEVLREIFDQQEKAVTNTTAALVNGTTLFTIAGGPIEILSLVARCVTTNDGTASTLQWSADPTDGVAVTISAASASLASVAAGGLVTCQGTTLATAPLVSASGANIAMAVTNAIVVGAGIITSTVGVGSTTGTWQHHLRYRPLARGVTVTGT